MTRRRGIRRKKLLDDLKDRRGYSHLKEEALDRTMWRNHFGEALDLSSDRLLNNNSHSDFHYPVQFLGEYMVQHEIHVITQAVIKKLKNGITRTMMKSLINVQLYHHGCQVLHRVEENYKTPKEKT